MESLKEGSVTIRNETADIISKELPVFYNPLMKHNRDISMLLLATEERKLQCCDLLAGSGIRAIRMLKEIPNIIDHITINDADNETFERIRKNLQENELEGVVWELGDFVSHSVKTDGPGSRERDPMPPVVISNMDANQLLLSSNGYDYIDIDPFGSPNTFLDAACKRISRKGILALTFTDTSALAGSYPAACERKYWGTPCDGPRKHEVGLRLLIRKVQLVAAQYDKALTPILVYNKDHYYRAYFRVEKGKQKCDALFTQHGRWDDEPAAGPLWLGSLADEQTITKMLTLLCERTFFPEEEQTRLREWLNTIRSENAFPQPGHYHDLNQLIRKIGRPLRKDSLLERLGNHGSAVHYEGNAIKTSLSYEDLKSLLDSPSDK